MNLYILFYGKKHIKVKINECIVKMDIIIANSSIVYIYGWNVIYA